MSNNKNLKGLAVACAFALGSTLIGGVPAQAYTGQLKATDLTLTPATGSKYSVPVGTEFLFESTVDSDLVREDVFFNEDGTILYGDSAPDLTFAVFNPNNLDLYLDTGTSQQGESDADFAEDGWSSNGDGYGDNTYFYGESDDIDDISYEVDAEDYWTDVNEDMDADYTAVNGNWDYDIEDVDGGQETIYNGAVSSDSSYQNIFSIDSEDAGSVDVVAFMDENDNGRIDGTEYVSTKRTVTFVSTNTADTVHVTATATINELELGSTYADVTVKFNQDINNEMVATVSGGDLGLYLTRNGASIDLVDMDYDDVTDADSLQYNFTDDVWYLATDLASGAAAGSYRAQVLYLGLDDYASLSAVYSLAAGTSADIDDILFEGPVASANNFDDGYSTTVRSGTKSITITGTVVDNEDVAIEEKTRVKVEVGSDGIDDSTTITVGGKSFSNSTDDDWVEYETTTNADGEFTISISSDKALDADDLYISAEALGTTGWVSDDNNHQVVWADAYIENAWVAEVLDYNEDNTVAVKADSTFNLNVGVSDQFGEFWKADGYRVTFADDNSEVEMGASKVLSGGKATVSLTDNDQDNSSSYNLDWWIEKKNTSGVWVSDYDSEDYVQIVTEGGTASTVTAEAEDVDVSYSDFAAADFRQDYNEYRADDLDEDSDYSWVEGYVRDSLGVPVVGTLVTISAPGDVAFIAYTDNGHFQTKGSITVRTSSDGYYGVSLLSHVAGDVVVTVKSGSASDTVTVDVLETSVVLDEDSTLKVVSSGAVAAGNVAGLTITLADKWGNAVSNDDVDVIVSVTGNAYVTNGQLLTVDGVANTTLIMGATAKGATVTAKAEYASGEYITKVVSLGKSSASIKGLTKQVRVNVSNAVGKTVKVFVDGKKKSTVVPTTAVQSILVPAKAGSHKVVVRINGVVTNTKTRTVK